MKHFLLAIIIAVSFCLWDSAFADSNYKVVPGNVLSISVYEEEDLSLDVRVDSDGYITYPLLGRIKVEGLPIHELENHLTGLLEKDFLVNPQVTIFVEEFGKVYVLGQVQKPGEYAITGNLSAVEAITLAGGLTKIASPNKTRVIRILDGNKSVTKVPVGKILKRGDRNNEDILLKPEDVVMVPESFF